jgi:hypothetical protein
MVLHTLLEELHLCKGSLDVLLDEADGLFTLENLVTGAVDLDEHEKLLADFVIF